MIGLDFYEDQENSLDILIKFQDEHQQPESHTHEELFLPTVPISVTSHPAAPTLQSRPHLFPAEETLADELVEKMRAACEVQERRTSELLARVDAGKDGSSGGRARVRKGSEGRSDEEEFVGKRKIIRKKRAE
jgi:hypothetical protein